MILRIVKMKFKAEHCDEFLELFNKYHSQIAGFKNCISVELLRDINEPQIFFTYSKWENESDLNNYRDSELFKSVWSLTKALFEQKAEAWSVEKIK
jgi:quinol monooxygenase YgiN